MKKLVCAILSLILCLGSVSALAQQPSVPEVKWDFPVPLTDVQSQYAMLVNGERLLDKASNLTRR